MMLMVLYINTVVQYDVWPIRLHRNDPMQASYTQPARTPVVPLSLQSGMQRHPPWPFPAARARPLSLDIAVNARKVIATTARAFLVKSSL